MIVPTLESLYEDGWVIPVCKPLNWTSFDVVAKVRNALKKHYGVRVKIGHAGTLDPLATGVLILCIGKATKSIEMYMNGVKGYRATLTFGATTPSYDRETKAVSTGKEIPTFSIEIWESVAKEFTGDLLQVPPVYSAVQINGKRAYAEARKGTMLELPPRRVQIHSMELVKEHKHIWEIEVKCSKGTYIRSLAHDIGAFLKCGAYLSSLERTQVGTITISECHTVEDILNFLEVKKDESEVGG